MTKISAVVITFNEEKNISRCINSLKKVADDIVVIDSYSTDKTKEICLSLNVRFEEHSFEGYIEQKNYAITKTLYPFILSLDADEELSPELVQSILKVKSNRDADAYTMNRLTNYCGKWIKHGGWYPDRKLRLFDSTKGKFSGFNPHDYFEMQKTYKVKHLKGDILHYSYNSIEQHIAQVNCFTSIVSKNYLTKKHNTYLLRMIISPFVKFSRDYILRAGFLDGYAGYLIARISANAVFIKYAKIIELHKNHKYCNNAK